MRRREFITIFAGAAGAWPRDALAQQSAIPVIGFLSSASPNAYAGRVAAFRLIASFNRPGGNITGASFVATELETKRLELLRDLVPAAALIGVLINPANPAADIGGGEPDFRLSSSRRRGFLRDFGIFLRCSQTRRWREPDSNHRSRLQKRAVDTRPFLVRFPFSLWHVIGFVSETLPTPPITRNQVELMAKDNRAGRRSSRPLPQAACVRREHRAIAGGGARCRLVGLRQGGFEQVIPASEPLSLRLSLVAVLAASLGLWALIWWTL
jgi:hypothetical protein